MRLTLRPLMATVAVLVVCYTPAAAQRISSVATMTNSANNPSSFCTAKRRGRSDKTGRAADRVQGEGHRRRQGDRGRLAFQGGHRRV
jgi:hypothetical protein